MLQGTQVLCPSFTFWPRKVFEKVSLLKSNNFRFSLGHITSPVFQYITETVFAVLDDQTHNRRCLHTCFERPVMSNNLSIQDQGEPLRHTLSNMQMS